MTTYHFRYFFFSQHMSRIQMTLEVLDQGQILTLTLKGQVLTLTLKGQV